MVILGQLDGEFAQYCPRAILALDLRARCAFALLAPHINSYKRFGTASFAPRTNSGGLDNKTAA